MESGGRRFRAFCLLHGDGVTPPKTETARMSFDVALPRLTCRRFVARKISEGGDMAVYLEFPLLAQRATKICNSQRIVCLQCQQKTAWLVCHAV